jgi:hypothetical protein
MSTAPVGGSAQPQEPYFGLRVLEIRAVQSVGVEKDGHGIVE